MPLNATHFVDLLLQFKSLFYFDRNEQSENEYQTPDVTIQRRDAGSSGDANVYTEPQVNTLYHIILYLYIRFIIWLCWIAVCSDFVEKKQKTLSLLQLSAVYTGGFWQCTCCNNKTITILQTKKFNLRKYNVNFLTNNKRSMQNEAIKVL